MVGGWQFDTVVSLGTGTPFDLTTNKGTNPSGQIINATFTNRVDLKGAITLPKSLHQWFNPAAFTPPPVTAAGIPIRPGTLGRNQIHGPGYHGADAALFKSFSLPEKMSFEFRFQVYNLSNTPQFQNPNGYWDSGTGNSNPFSNFGSIGTTREYTERQLEFGGRLRF